MAVVKGRGWRRLLPSAPQLQDNTDELVQEFLEKGVLHIPRKGDGIYTLMRGKSFKGFPCILYWEGRGQHGGAISHGTYGHHKYGGQILISPRSYGWGNEDGWTEEEMARMFIQVIQSGRKLSQLYCGNPVSSTNSDKQFRSGYYAAG